MSDLVYDPGDTLRVEWREEKIDEAVQIPAPGFAARSVVDYAVESADDRQLVRTTPSASPPIATPDAEYASVAVGSITAADPGTSLVDAYETRRQAGRELLSTPGVPTFVVFDRLVVPDSPRAFLQLSVHPSLYPADHDGFVRPPSRRDNAWHDRFDDLPVETIRLRPDD